MRVRVWGVALALSAVIAAACAAPSVDGDGITPSEKLPTRSGEGTDAGSVNNNNNNNTKAPTTTGDAGGDGGGGDAKAPSQTCAVGGLALCFTFEGVTTDLSGSPIAPSNVQNVAFVPGKEGLAASFNQASILRFNPNAVFELPTNSATVEAWLKRQNAGADAVVFDDDGRFSLTINAAGNVWCKSSGGALVGTKVVPVDQWAHVACVIDNGTMHAYLNGVEDIAGPGAVGSAPDLAATIGGNSPDGEPWIGLIDSFRVFRVARSAALIAADAAE